MLHGSKELKVISFVAISKLSRIETLKASSVEYICLDSSDNNGRTKKGSLDKSVFEQIPIVKSITEATPSTIIVNGYDYKTKKPQLFSRGSLCLRYPFSRLGQLSFAVKKHAGGMF